MSLFPTVEAETLFEVVFSFFRGELRDTDRINVNGVRIMGGAEGHGVQ